MLHVSKLSISVPLLCVALTFFVGTLSGCGGGAAPVSPSPTVSDPPSEAAPAGAMAAEPQPGSPGGAASGSGRSRAPNERWTDANGVQYLGDVPLDVFFDHPHAVASDTTPLAGTAPAPATGGLPEEIPAVAMNPGVSNVPPATAASTAPATANTATANTAGATAGWDDILPIQDLDEEVTSVRNFLNQSLQSVGSYNSSMLMIPPKAATMAALATILEKHSGDIAWKEDAAYIRNLAKKMNESTLQRGKKDQSRLLMLFENMTDTFNRSRPSGLEEPPADDSFSDVAEMRLLMMRMESAEKKMKNEAGSETAFGSQKPIVLHEAALLGTMSKVVTQSGYGYADDPEFVGYATRIVEAAKEIRDAAETGNFGAYELALTKVSGACQECHSAYKNN